VEESLKRIGYLLEMEKRKEGYNQYILSAKIFLIISHIPKAIYNFFC